MSQAAPSSKTVFRACVVNAVRGGEALMDKLIAVTRSALTAEESTVRNIQQRNLASDSLRLLGQHEAALVKGYSMALLEIFAEGPPAAAGKSRSADASPLDFGELSLMDESEMQSQVELARAQQLASHATEAILAELNTLVSSAQGLRSVQPERNPLRPESYIRALQQVVGETGVNAEVRGLWMQHMRDLLGKLLVDEYKTMVKTLRDNGVEPVGYAVLGAPGAGARTGGSMQGGGGGNTGYGGGYAGTGYGGPMGGPSGYGNAGYGNTGYGRGMGGGQHNNWSGDPNNNWSGEAQMPAPMMSPQAAAAEEALLTVGILRQMLAGGDPFDPRGYGGMGGGVPSQPAAMQSAWAGGGGGAASGAASMHSGLGGAYHPGNAVAEAMEDMAQLERLVGRLAGVPQAVPQVMHQVPQGGWAPTTPGTAPQHLYTVPGMPYQQIYTVPVVAPQDPPAMAAEVVGRMMENIARDSRLLPSVQRAVQNLEPALKHLVRRDQTFFTEPAHPARVLLDEMTQRSLAFPDEKAPGFARFIRLLNESVGYLAGIEIKDATPFETVLKALQAAWNSQVQKAKARQAEKDKAALQAEQREMLAGKIAADIRKLPDLERVPADVLDFAAGPWAEVVALAQVAQAAGGEDDPGGYLALVPLLLWSAQPELTRAEPDRLSEAIPGLLVKLREGLQTIDHPAAKTSAFLERLVGLHQDAFERAAFAKITLDPEDSVQDSRDPNDSVAAVAGYDDSAQALVDIAPPEPAAAAPTKAEPYAEFVVGAWVELISNGRAVHTQLTWSSPHGTLFLFTAPDNSTQSMTRRMRDKLADEGALRVVPAPKARPPAAAATATRAGGIATTRGSLPAPLETSRGKLGSAPSSRQAPLGGKPPAKGR
ncbi:DUF1631 family protein [Acidovorax sp. Root219]|uniref:DUF1631 family protein n=1 Tax=Acidovorax sp. Root219 TaxID=1736493 RepID=UPI000709D66F|nr:DUF1631 family protein [Acidovorax sp. Root219]KRC20493.1 peptidase [Acidovorax sp. Root219]